MELSGRLIPDWDNRVLMTPFIGVFIFFCIFTIASNDTETPVSAAVGRTLCLLLQKQAACCACCDQLPILPICQVKEN